MTKVTVAPERLVLGLHAPPYDTQLDVAPKIDWDTLTVAGRIRPSRLHRGQGGDRRGPAHPVSARAHPREPGGRAIGRTLAINPGSSYDEGMVSGCVVDLDGKNKIKNYRLTSG